MTGLQEKAETAAWYVYIVRCRDNSLYTGITRDLTRRVLEHNAGIKGARYTRSRRPVTLVYSEQAPSRSVAASRENQIKKLKITGKHQLLTGISTNPATPGGQQSAQGIII
jgi:putative endonuclease